MERLTDWSNRMRTAINLILELERRNMITLDMGALTLNDKRVYGKAIMQALKDVRQMDYSSQGTESISPSINGIRKVN